MQSVKKNRRALVEQWWHCSSGDAEQLRVANKWSAGLKPTVFHEALQVNLESAAQDVGEGTGGDGKQQAEEDEHRRHGYKDPSIQVLRRSYMHVWGKTKGEHIGWRNHKEWQAKCKDAEIPDAPEASFRRWKKKEMAAFDCEPTKDTAESAPIRHRDQVLRLLEQVIRDREFAQKTIVQHEPELQSTHKGVTRPFRILPAWYQELKDRCLEVIKLPGFGASMVAYFAAQLYGEKMNLPDAETIMYKPSERWAFWFNFLHLLNRSVTPPLPPDSD